MGIRKSVNDVDLFLQGNPQWKNILNESHPEVCFVILNGGELMKFKKTEVEGLKERLNILQLYGIDTIAITEHLLYNKYGDDVLDAVCLALVGSFLTLGKYKTLPSEDKIKVDSTGLKMQMVIPICDNV